MTALAIDKPRGRAWWKELWIQVLIAMAADGEEPVAAAACGLAPCMKPATYDAYE
ncbi:hypothetical protein [Bradyrhizobium neotropicale]|uniref:hypothetical protein n=1 Tax=Bradyrhizobium neotropicale TaxID=1497615 RepID=UPI000A6298C4|nr:hypothetical protein [Bradyrhizobium neotropicale]